MTKSQVFRKPIAYGHELIVIAQMQEFHNQEPYFSITYTEYSRAGLFVSGGSNSELIEEEFPMLKKYVRWHLCSASGPMHYLANSMYHLENGQIEYFRSTAVWGALEDDEYQTLETNADVKAYLIERLSKLQELFRHDMAELLDVEFEQEME